MEWGAFLSEGERVYLNYEERLLGEIKNVNIK
jgi:hypothetical protein